MLTLVHISAERKPVGVWWAEQDELRSAYKEDTEALQLRATIIMEGKIPEVSWENFWKNQLVNVHPYIDSFEVVDVPNPRGYLFAV